MGGEMNDSITLYAESMWVSPWVFHAMAALEEKGLPYALELLPLPIPAEQKEALAERAILGKVPALAHGELCFTESMAISEYLAERFPYPAHPRLFPEDLAERARARQVMSWLRTDLMALREARPTTSVFVRFADEGIDTARVRSLGAPVSTPLAGKAREQADELIRVASRLIAPGRTTMFADWCIADTDLALTLMRLIKNGDEVPAHVVAAAEATWARPSVRAFLDRIT
jgi:glutathione S-transferase